MAATNRDVSAARRVRATGARASVAPRALVARIALILGCIPLAPACTMAVPPDLTLPQADAFSEVGTDVEPGSPRRWQERLPQSQQGRPAHAAYPRGRREPAESGPPPAFAADGGEWQRTPYRRRRGWAGFATVTLGRGDYDYEDRALGDDDTDSTYFRLRAAAVGNQGFGGGIDFQMFSLDDTFYEGSQDETSAEHFDLYLHLLAHPAAGTFRMPVRIGPYLSWTAAQFEDSGDYTDYISVGLRFEAQPEIVLFESAGGSEISVFGRVAGGVHGTSIRDQSTDETYDSSGTTLGLEAGIRFTFGNASLGASYILHENVTRESDERDFGNDVLVIPRLETEFDGFVVTLGVSF